MDTRRGLCLRIFAVAVSLTVCGPAWNEAAQADRLSSVVLDDAPVRLSPIRVDAAADPAVVVFAIQNVGQEVITSLQVTAFVFASDGHARGFTTFRTEATIALGASREVASVLRLKPQAGDTVVLVPREVRGSAGEVLWLRTSHEALDDALSLVRGVPPARAVNVRPWNDAVLARLAPVTLAQPGGEMSAGVLQRGAGRLQGTLRIQQVRRPSVRMPPEGVFE